MANQTSISVDEQRQQLFLHLYKKAFPAVAGYVARLGGSFDDAKDVFQDALIIFHEKQIAQKGDVDNSIGYLVGTAKHIWLKKHQQKSKFTTLDGAMYLPDKDEEHCADYKVMNFLQRAGKKCMNLLKSFYYDELPLVEIAHIYGFSGVRSATVQKYKCLEKVRETIKQKAITYDDFLA